MGKRGEGWVVGQFVIGGAAFIVALLTRTTVAWYVILLGIVLIVLGMLLLALAVLRLGENLSAFPKPREGKHSLVTSGAYGIVRHPIYSGILTAAFGWSILWGSLPGLVLTVVLLIWLDLKSRREEQWLVEQYPEYTAYRARVKKLVPFIY